LADDDVHRLEKQGFSAGDDCGKLKIDGAKSELRDCQCLYYLHVPNIVVYLNVADVFAFACTWFS